jgi:hypothetical protein
VREERREEKRREEREREREKVPGAAARLLIVQ